MVKLFHFNAGDPILSLEVNANFNALAQIVGTNSTAAVLALPGKVALGDRDAATISALTDKTKADNGYLHLGWNASETIDATGAIKLNRSGGLQDGAAVVRIGSQGLAVLGTDSETSNLNNMPTLFAIRQNQRIYIHPALSFTNVNSTPNEISDYRLTLVPLEEPIKLLETSDIPNKGDSYSFSLTRKLRNFVSILGGYRGVQLRVAATRNPNVRTTGRIEVFGEGTDVNTGILFFANNDGMNVTKGPVFLHKGKYTNDNIVVRVRHELKALRIDVVGVWK